MLNLSPARMWAIIGAVGCALILAAGYLLLVSPQKATRSQLNDQVVTAQALAATNNAQLRALSKDNKKLEQYSSLASELQAALPTSAKSGPFVVNMQHLSELSHVNITSLTVTPPTAPTPAAVDPASTDTTSASPAPAVPTTTAPAAPTTTELPITLVAAGTTADLERFLHLLQHNADRALLISQVAESAPTDNGSSAGSTAKPTLNIQATAFFTTSS